jgi:hypothetical protein
MSRTPTGIDDDAPALAAALREVANRRAVSKVLQQLRTSETDLSAEAMKGEWHQDLGDRRGTRATVLRVDSRCQMITDMTGQPLRRLGTS